MQNIFRCSCRCYLGQKWEGNVNRCAVWLCTMVCLASSTAKLLIVESAIKRRNQHGMFIVFLKTYDLRCYGTWTWGVRGQVWLMWWAESWWVPGLNGPAGSLPGPMFNARPMPIARAHPSRLFTDLDRTSIGGPSSWSRWRAQQEVEGNRTPTVPTK